MTEKQINNWVDYMDKNIDDFNNVKMILQSKFDAEPRPEDVIWKMFNNNILEISTGDENNILNKLKSNYQLMASFLLEVENKDPFDIVKKVREIELKQFQEVGIYPKVRILTLHEGTCSTAKKIRNKIYTLADAMNEMPLPSPLCKNKIINKKIPFCTCQYSPLMENEKI